MKNLYIHRSGTHAHLSKSTARELGLPDVPEIKSPLAIAGEYVTNYRLVLLTTADIQTIPILGGWRDYSQIETCRGDNRKLGEIIPEDKLQVRLSGDIEGLPTVRCGVLGSGGFFCSDEIDIPIMIPKMHFHSPKKQPEAILRCSGASMGLFPNIPVRKSKVGAEDLLLHLNTDEFNFFSQHDRFEVMISGNNLRFKNIFVGNEYAPSLN